MELIPAPLLFLAVAALLATLVYWFGTRAIRRQNRKQRLLESMYGELQDSLQKDPARLGIDLGKEYAANKMRATVDEIIRETENPS